jgi:hypothetical protein
VNEQDFGNAAQQQPPTGPPPPPAGSPMPPGHPPSGRNPVPSTRSRRNPAVIVGIIAAVAVVALIGIFLVTRLTSSTPTSGMNAFLTAAHDNDLDRLMDQVCEAERRYFDPEAVDDEELRILTWKVIDVNDITAPADRA